MYTVFFISVVFLSVLSVFAAYGE